MTPNFFRRCVVCSILAGSVPAGAMTETARWPAAGATGVGVDTPLRIAFDAEPRPGSGGRIRVIDTETGAEVDAVDPAAAVRPRPIGGTTYNTIPVLVADREAYVALRPGALAYGRTYAVRIDRGALTDAGGAPWEGVAEGAWRFTTKPAPPAAGAATLTVAADGTGDFATIQGAFDFVPANNTRPITIHVRPGIYREILLLRNRPFVTLRGGDRRRTIVAYANNANLNPGNARALAGIDSDDFTLENLTLRNLTPPGGSQAEALRTNSRRCTVRDVDFYSYQDTLFLNGRVYLANCFVEGDVDFIWGGGAAYFYRCEIRANRRGYNVQSRSGAGQRGYVFVECTLTAAAGVAGHVLARTDTTTFPACEVAYIDCTIGPHIAPGGWIVTGTGGTANLRFLEYGSRDPAGAPLDVSRRAAGSRQLGADEAAQLRAVAYVLDGWEPLAARDTSSPGGPVGNSPAGSTTRLVNVSVGSFAGTGERSLIAGFSLRGAGAKPVLVRGIGPALAAFGVADVLADPRVEVVAAGGAAVADNDDWETAAGAGALAAAVGAFAFPAGGRDAAAIATVGAGSYTAQVRGAGQTTGRAQIEVYDGAPAQAALGLSNLSARAELAAGDTLIAGFVLAGSGARSVLIRAAGPALGLFGLNGTLADPRLELHAAGGTLFENDNWTTEIAPTAARVGAFAFEAGSRDAALLVSLAPGAYTAHVRGGGAGSATGGLVLLEVYDVP